MFSLPLVRSSLRFPSYAFFGSLLCWAFINFCTVDARASHAVGADLTYIHISGNQYQFKLVFYRDCNSATQAPNNPTLNVASPSGCGAAATIALTQLGTALDITPLCPGASSSCSGGSTQGVQRYIYTATYTFPTACADWVVSYNLQNRNVNTNSNTANNYSLYVEAIVNNSSPTIGDNSPDFTQAPVSFICAGQPFTFNHGVSDIDGDSLVYSLISPRGCNNGGNPGPCTPIVNVPYIAGLSATYPISTTPANNFTFSNTTGQVTFTPNGQQIGIMTVLVKEYRNGVFIGSVQRDIEIIVRACTNNTPTLGPVTSFSGGTFASQNNSGTFKVCLGSTLTFSITASDADAAQILSVLGNASGSFPGSTITTVGVNPSIITFAWTPTAADVGQKTLTFQIQDNGCPTNSFIVAGYTINVYGVTASANHHYICNGQPATLALTAHAYDVTNGFYSWYASPANVTFVPNTSSASVSATMSQPTTIYVSYLE